MNLVRKEERRGPKTWPGGTIRDSTCLGEVLEKFSPTLDSDYDRSNNRDSDSDDGSEGGYDLDADDDEDQTSLVDEPSALSEVVLAHKRGQYTFTFLLLSLLRGETARGYPLASFWELGRHIQQENLEDLVRRFLFYQQNPTFTGTPPISACPALESVDDISVFHSAKAVFRAPGNPSSIGGPNREIIWCTPK